MVIAKRNIMGGKKSPYKRRLAYLEGTGTQFIDTGAKISSEDTVRVSFSASVDNEPRAIYGFRNSATSNNVNTNCNNGTIYVDRGSYTINRLISKYNFGDNIETVNSPSWLEIVINGLSVGTKSVSPVSIASTHNCRLFDSYGVTWGKARAKIYRFSIDGKISLIPVMSWNDTPEMFDEVTQTFAERHGDFLYGELNRGGV